MFMSLWILRESNANITINIVCYIYDLNLNSTVYYCYYAQKLIDVKLLQIIIINCYYSM